MASRMFEAAKSPIRIVEPMVTLAAQLSLKDQSVPRPGITFRHARQACFSAPRGHANIAINSSNVRTMADAKAHRRMLQSGVVEGMGATLTT
jgi:hypothetical protein